jgi:hypothetical protein
MTTLINTSLLHLTNVFVFHSKSSISTFILIKLNNLTIGIVPLRVGMILFGEGVQELHSLQVCQTLVADTSLLPALSTLLSADKSSSKGSMYSDQKRSEVSEETLTCAHCPL